MGDRCWLEVTVRKEQAERFLRCVSTHYEVEREDGVSITFSFPEANYGMGSELEQASVAGCQFYGEHARGSAYGAYEFYSSGHNEVEYLSKGEDNEGHVVCGSTPEERLGHLRRLEVRILERDTLIERIHNPLYDLIREAADEQHQDQQ